jgi:hypothetical protein
MTNNGTPVQLRWKQREELLQFFHVKHPNHQCQECDSTGNPTVTVRRFSNKHFARFDCMNCGTRISVIDWSPKRQ